MFAAQDELLAFVQRRIDRHRQRETLQQNGRTERPEAETQEREEEPREKQEDFISLYMQRAR